MVTAAALLFVAAVQFAMPWFAAAKVPLPRPRPAEAPSAKAGASTAPEKNAGAEGRDRASRLPPAGSP